MNDILISIVIPTYHRPTELRRCIRALNDELLTLDGSQREKLEIIISDNGLSGDVNLLLKDVCALCNVVLIRRFKNIGAQRNIINASEISSGQYFMWLTDDDFLLEGSLSYLINSIERYSGVGYFWGCLPTFDARSGKYFCVAGDSFDKDTLIPEGRESASKYGRAGWALTRQIYKKDMVDFSAAYKMENAYFPILMAAKQMIGGSSVYLSRPYVGHSYYNFEYWEEWGEDQLFRSLRIFLDSLMALDDAICPLPNEREIINNIYKFKKECLDGYFNSKSYSDLVARSGLSEVVGFINNYLSNKNYLVAEIIEYINNFKNTAASG
jgi:glycosyltransferase involved in cell wall biosynthesis